MIGRAGEVILPEAFLASAEKYGLIAEIDRGSSSRPQLALRRDVA